MALLARPGHGLLYRLHPVTRLALTLPVLAILPFAGQGLLAAVFAMIVLVAAASGVGGVMARRLAVVLVPVALALLVIHGALIPRGQSWPFGPVTLYPDGLRYGSLILLRLACLMAAGLLVVTSTPPGLLADGLEDKGLPPGAAYLLTAPLSLAESLAQEGAAIRDALQIRGLPLAGSPVQRLRALSFLVIALVRAQLIEAAPRAQALEGRGFRSQPVRRLLNPPRDSQAQFLARLALLALAVIILGVGIWANFSGDGRLA